MKQSTLCKMAADLRLSYENDGYTLYDTSKYGNSKAWFYLHDNGNRITISLNLDDNVLRIYKNARLIQKYE